MNKKLTNKSGLFRFKPETKNWTLYQHNPAQPNSLSNDILFATTLASNGDLWIGTWGGGVNVLPYGKKQFIHYKSEVGLASNVIFAIQEDKKGNLWISTPSGLHRLTPCHRNETSNAIDRTCSPEIIRYTTADGLLNNEFDSDSYYQSTKGELFFGGIDGIIAFKPDTMELTNLYPPTTTFVNPVKVLGQTKGTYSNQEYWLDSNQQISLKHDQQPFVIYLANNEFTAPELNLFQYRIPNGNWISIDNQSRSLTFNHLSNGSHEFEFRSSNNDGVWEDKSTLINITIIPPFYQSNLAYFIYISLIISALIAFSFHRKRYHQRREQNLTERIRIKTAKISETNQALEIALKDKQHFFENVSHELKTPLTLIFNGLESLQSKDFDQQTRDKLSAINRNGHRLFHLIEQLLSLANQDPSENKKVQIISVTKSCEQVISDIQSMATKQQIWITHSHAYDIELILEELVLNTILINLISNGIKYGYPASHIHVNSFTTDTSWVLQVSNQGDGLDKSELTRIFNKFERKSEHLNLPGSGIGLALTKELVERYDGEIFATSTPGNTTVFTVRLPRAHIFNLGQIKPWGESEQQIFSHEEKNKLKLLIVEDNQEIQSHLLELLQSEYCVTLANDGQQALLLLNQGNYNAVLSDVMMPVMDGLTLCKEIHEHSDKDFKNLPIILLTAKNDLNSQMQGLIAGATDYIGKPFSGRVLKLKLNNLFVTLNELHKEITNNAFEEKLPSNCTTVLDKRFVTMLKQVLVYNYQNPDLNVIKMADLMAMDERTLRRKTNQYFNKQPNNLLRDYRLKCAHQMLDSDESITQVAFAAGFSSAAHFSKTFKGKFSHTPKQVQADYLTKRIAKID